MATEITLEEALERIDELEDAAEQVSQEFEKECWIVVRKLLDETNFDWDGDPVTADMAYEHLHEVIRDLERRAVPRGEAA